MYGVFGNFASSHQMFLLFFSVSSGHPSIRSGLRTSSSPFPAAAAREDSHKTASALLEEDRQTTTRVQRQIHTKTGLPARLQHAQMYEVQFSAISENDGSVSLKWPGEERIMVKGRNKVDLPCCRPYPPPHLYIEHQWSCSTCRLQYSLLNCSFHCILEIK